jgi:glycosyltransferase involved in cell wall biosynthesis
VGIERPVRLTFVLTHPVQYFAPLFRHIHAHEPRLSLTVIYAALPTPEQQGAGFGKAFEWDVPLLDGYRSIVLRSAQTGDAFGSDTAGVDAADGGSAIEATHPDVVVVPGWHSAFYRRVLVECRRRRIPVLYRGDTNLQTVHRGVAKWAWHLRTQIRLRQFDGYLSVGTRSREFLRRFGAPADRIFDSPHAVDNAYFAAGAAPRQTHEGRRAARARFGIGLGEFVVLFAGKLEDQKRPLDAVRAAAAAQATLLVAGAGPLETMVREEAARTGAQVRLAGFLNQSQMPEAYAAADCLVLPSRRETWGLVVNEALAIGLPCVVSDGCGCAPDLVDDATGAIFAMGDTADLARALQHVRARLASDGGSYDAACRARVGRFSLARAIDGLVVAAHAMHAGSDTARASSPRLVAWCGHFVQPGGLERATCQVFHSLIGRGATVHALLNDWDSTRIAVLVEASGATWSTISYRQALSRRTIDPRKLAAMVADVAVSSAELLREVRRRAATHVFLPDFMAAIRCAPALAWLRLRGVPVVMRVGNAPAQTPFYRFLWRVVINAVTTQFVCNSTFTAGELIRCSVPAGKVSRIYNTVPLRIESAAAMDAPQADVIFVGQLIPEKGVDVLLEAVARVIDAGHDITLNIVGDLSGWVPPAFAGYRETLQARASAPDLAGHVRFLGYRDDVPALLAAAAVHCCPSHLEIRESLANVVIEAKRAGIPSVVTRAGSLPEMVAHRQTGWVCDTATPHAIAEGLLYFVRDAAARRAAGQAAAVSLAMFDADVFSAAWWHVFTRLDEQAPVVRENGAPLEVPRR